MPQALVEIEPYTLADSVMMNAGSNCAMVWRVDQTCVVVGQGNQVLDSLNLFSLTRDKIKVYRRPSGGQPVLLSQRTAQVTIALFEKKLTNPSHHFARINGFLAELIAKELGLTVFFRGVSDLATTDERKILGSSMFRSRNRVVYHGVLNLAETALTVSRYLLHPPQEPEYRRGRSHSDFISSLAEQLPGLDAEHFFEILKARIEGDFFSAQLDSGPSRSSR